MKNLIWFIFFIDANDFISHSKKIRFLIKFSRVNHLQNHYHEGQLTKICLKKCLEDFSTAEQNIANRLILAGKFRFSMKKKITYISNANKKDKFICVWFSMNFSQLVKKDLTVENIKIRLHTNDITINKYEIYSIQLIHDVDRETDEAT